MSGKESAFIIRTLPFLLCIILYGYMAWTGLSFAVKKK